MRGAKCLMSPEFSGLKTRMRNSRRMVRPMKEISVGDQLDHYRVDALVATGTHASIFRAVDLKNGAVVAIKVPHFELDLDPVFQNDFGANRKSARN